MPSRSPEWVARLSKLYTPVVADVLDKLGYRQQVMTSDVRPLYPDAKIAGFALTVQIVPARRPRRHIPMPVNLLRSMRCKRTM